MPVKPPSEAADRASFSGAVLLTDAQWREIVAIRRPRVPEAVARAALEQALAEYRGYVRDPKTLKGARERAWRIVKPARELVAVLSKRPPPWPEYEAVVAMLWRAENHLDALDILLNKNAKRLDPVSKFLLPRLCDVWVEFFGGALTVTDRPKPAKPTGALVRFIAASTRGMFASPINPYLIRNVARRELKKRKRLAKEIKIAKIERFLEAQKKIPKNR